MISGTIPNGGTTVYSPSNNTFLNINTVENKGNGISIEGGTTNTFIGGQSAGNIGYGFYINTAGNYIIGLYSEQNHPVGGPIGVFTDVGITGNIIIGNQIFDGYKFTQVQNTAIEGSLANIPLINSDSISTVYNYCNNIRPPIGGSIDISSYDGSNWKDLVYIGSGVFKPIADRFWFLDETDTSKIAKFNLTGIAHNTTRTVTCIDKDITLAGIVTVQTTLSGTTVGTFVHSMPFQGSSYKRFLGRLNNYQNNTFTAQTITFPTAFSQIPALMVDNTGGSSVSTTTLTLPTGMTSAKTGLIIVEGY